MSKNGQEYTEIEHFLATARKAGCPVEQMDYFVRAELVLQLRQLVASAAARLCGKPDGRIAISCLVATKSRAVTQRKLRGL